MNPLLGGARAGRLGGGACVLRACCVRAACTRCYREPQRCCGRDGPPAGWVPAAPRRVNRISQPARGYSAPHREASEPLTAPPQPLPADDTQAAMAHRQMSLQGAQRSVMRLDAYSRHKKFVNGVPCGAHAHTTRTQAHALSHTRVLLNGQPHAND